MPAAPIAPQSPGSPPGRQRRGRLWLAALAVSALAGYAANELFTRAPSPVMMSVQPPDGQGVPAMKPFFGPLPGICKVPQWYAEAFLPGCPGPQPGRSFGITFGSNVGGVPASGNFSAGILAIPSATSAVPEGAALCSLEIKGGTVDADQCAFGLGSYRLFVIDPIATTFDKLGIGTSTHLSCVAQPSVVVVTGPATRPVTLVCK